MSLRVCILGSSSSGNCTYIGTDSTSILVDAGLSGRATAQRLSLLGLTPGEISGICLSHEHSDHVAGLRVLHKRHGIPIFANAGTIEAIQQHDAHPCLSWHRFETGMAFQIGMLKVEPFSVSHDAYDPVGFVVEARGVRIGIVMDLGTVTELVRERLRHCEVVVMESNYDRQLLLDAARPWQLKQRIMGRQGHLSNDHASALLADIAGPSLKKVYLAHLSEQCNREELAIHSARTQLSAYGYGHVQVSTAYQNRISEVWTS